MSYVWPNGLTDRPPITSHFGPRPAPMPGASTDHRGTDFVGFTDVRSVTAGTVDAVGVLPGWTRGGTQVLVRNDDGTTARYCHLASTSVRKGQRVAPGTVVGVMGMTGTATAVHLHFELARGGVQFDPVPYLADRIRAAAPAALAPEEQENPDMAISVINIKGARGKRNGGYYAVVARPGAKPAAVFAGRSSRVKADGVLHVTDENAIKELQKLVEGLR